VQSVAHLDGVLQARLCPAELLASHDQLWIGLVRVVRLRHGGTNDGDDTPHDLQTACMRRITRSIFSKMKKPLLLTAWRSADVFAD
jgi:hypothetical protein